MFFSQGGLGDDQKMSEFVKFLHWAWSFAFPGRRRKDPRSQGCLFLNNKLYHFGRLLWL